MRIAFFTLLSLSAVKVYATYVTCPRYRWKRTVTLEAGDLFKFKTQTGRVYRGPVKCIVNYKLGGTCGKARFWCDRSFVHNEDLRSCSRGDKIIVKAGKTKKTYCGKRRPRINAFGNVKVAFLSNKRGRDRGAVCNVQCTRTIKRDVLLIAGGYNRGDYLSSSEVYGSPTCSVPDLPSSRDGVNTVYFDNQVLACGGYRDIGGSDELCYRLEASEWSQHSNMTSPRDYSSSVVVGGLLYMLGGEYDMSTSAVLATGSTVWTPGPKIPGDVFFSCAVAFLEGFVIIGSSSDGYKTQVLNYDGSNWNNWPNLSENRTYHSCVLFSETIIVAGGETDTEDPSATTVIINTITKSSSPGPNMVMPRGLFAFANVNGVLLAVGGYGSVRTHATGEIFNPVNGGTLYKNMTAVRYFITGTGVVPKKVLAEIIGCP